MKKGGKVVDERLREAVRSTLTDHFQDFTKEYEKLNPAWIAREFMRHAYEGLLSFQHYLEDPSDEFVTWNTPRTRLIYSVEMDWEKWPTPRIIADSTKIDDVDPDDVAKVFAERFLRQQRIAALSRLTHGVIRVMSEEDERGADEEEEYELTEEELATFTRLEAELTPEDEAELNRIIADAERETDGFLFGGDYLLPLPILERLRDLPEEESRKRLEELAYRSVMFPLQGEGEGEEKNYVFVSVSPLTVLPHKKEAYFQTIIDLRIDAYIQEHSPTEEELLGGLAEFLQEFEKAIPKDKIPKRKFRIRDEGGARPTAALPSSPVFQAILALFSGKPDFVPTTAIAKHAAARTEDEQRKVDEFIRSRVHPTPTTLDRRGEFVPATHRRIVTVSSGPLVAAKGEVDPDLFEGDPEYEHEKLARLVAKTYGPEGLRHFLGIVVALERNGRKGWIDWDVDVHLDALGIDREKSGAHKTSHKKSAYEIALLMTNLTITEVKGEKSGAGELRQMKLFTITGRTARTTKNVVVKERLRIEATSFWYEDSLRDVPGRGRQYTKLLQSIAAEDHRTHPYVIQLGAQFAIDWRIDGGQPLKLKVPTLCRRLGIPKDRKRLERLRKLEAELDYMKEREHLGDWFTKSGTRPSESTSPDNEVFVFVAPDWFQKDLARIREGREMHRLAEKARKMTSEEFADVLHRSGLSAKLFAAELGISPALVSRILNGKRGVSPEVEKVLLEKFAPLLEQGPPTGEAVAPSESRQESPRS